MSIAQIIWPVFSMILSVATRNLRLLISKTAKFISWSMTGPMYLVHKVPPVPRWLARPISSTVSAALPNTILLLPLIAIIVGLLKRDQVLGRGTYDSPFAPGMFRFYPFGDRSFFGIEYSRDGWVPETAVMVGVLIALNLLILGLFARRTHARRWGRKPPEIERSTRFFLG